MPDIAKLRADFYKISRGKESIPASVFEAFLNKHDMRAPGRDYCCVDGQDGQLNDDEIANLNAGLKEANLSRYMFHSSGNQGSLTRHIPTWVKRIYASLDDGKGGLTFNEFKNINNARIRGPE